MKMGHCITGFRSAGWGRIEAGVSSPGETTDPDAVRRERTEQDEQEVRDALRQFLPSADAVVASIRICMYTNSPDHHFIIDRHPQHENVTIACGFSGHGFKFASVMGQVLADLATRGATDLPADFLSMQRLTARR
jgi:glycine/D-amino acid oxidase-like deaminating enzyme